MGSKFTSVSVLTSQRDAVREMIFKKDFLGYRSVSEFIRDAVREKLRDCELQTDPRKKEEPWLR